MTAPSIKVVEINLAEAPIGLRLPFKYGSTTLNEAVEARVSLRIRDAQGREAMGFAAEVMAPKWFDKTPELSNAQNVAQLRLSLLLARDRYLATDPMPAFSLSALNEARHHEACLSENLPHLVAGFGIAQMDKAVLSALRRLFGLTRRTVITSNVMGLTAETASDLADVDFDGFLRGLRPCTKMLVRHTVGGVDPLYDHEVARENAPDDGLPVSLQAALERYGLRAFKLKLSGDVDYDIERLTRIAEVLDPIEAYLCTLDGNEQFQSAEAAYVAWRRLKEVPSLGRLMASVAYLEQPLSREIALTTSLHQLADEVDVIIDESDDSMAAFPIAMTLGYKGVSIKSCKGVYRSLLNAARLACGASSCFLSAEDLCTQPGPGVEDDLALASSLGLTHIERNGHHFGDGASWSKEPGSGFLPDTKSGIYTHSNGALSLRPNQGLVDTSALLNGSPGDNNGN